MRGFLHNLICMEENEISSFWIWINESCLYGMQTAPFLLPPSPLSTDQCISSFEVTALPSAIAFDFEWTPHSTPIVSMQ